MFVDAVRTGQASRVADFAQARATESRAAQFNASIQALSPADRRNGAGDVANRANLTERQKSLIAAFNTSGLHSYLA